MPPVARGMRQRLAYAGGTFDLFHAGHVRFFAQVKAAVADALIVSLNTDAFAARYKRRPVMPLADRLTLVAACRYVDAVVINEGDEDSTVAIAKVRPSCIVHGNDWTGEALMRQMGLSPAFLRTRDIRLVYVPYSAGVSTSQLLARIQGD